MKLLKLTGNDARKAACIAVMAAPDGWMVKVSEPRKSRDQEERYHAMVGEIARQYRFCDRMWDTEDMKRLCLDQFRRDTINDPEFKELWMQVSKIELAPSLDGSGTVALGVQSRRFPKTLATAFIEWLFAFGADHDVVFREVREISQRDMAEMEQRN